MNDRVHLDTNVVVMAMGGDKRLSALVHGRYPLISFVVEMELLCYPLQSAEEQARMRAFLKDVRVMDMDERVRSEAVKIRKEHKLKLLDAIVAATARVDRIALLTAEKQFMRLKEEQSVILYEQRKS